MWTHWPFLPCLALTALVVAAGCSPAPAQGPQLVSVRTDPPGAACAVRRVSTPLGVIDPTPGTLAVDRSDKDLTVSCTKPGRQPASGTIATHYNGVGIGRLLTAGAAGVVEDAVKSADFSYDPAGLELKLPPAGP